MLTVDCPVHGITEQVKDGSSGNKQKYTCGKCKRERLKETRERFKQMALDYKGGCCVLCGYNNYDGALEFHHVIPSMKTADSRRGMISQYHTWTKLQKELDKCILVCANCHREIHAGMHPEYAIAD